MLWGYSTHILVYRIRMYVYNSDKKSELISSNAFAYAIVTISVIILNIEISNLTLLSYMTIAIIN